MHSNRSEYGFKIELKNLKTVFEVFKGCCWAYSNSSGTYCFFFRKDEYELAKDKYNAHFLGEYVYKNKIIRLRDET